jgi:hypothetical protein
MPAGKSQSSSLPYGAIVFASLFIISTTIAVIFYVKAEDYRTQLTTVEEETDRIANSMQRRNAEELVGKTERNQTYMGALLDYVDSLVGAITGAVPEQTTAAVKVNSAKLEINDTMKQLGESAPVTLGPEGVDLLNTISTLKNNLDQARNEARNMENLLIDVQDEFDLAVENFRQEEQQLIQQKNRIQAQADEVQKSYDMLRQRMEQAADQQLESHLEMREQTEVKLNTRTQELLKTEAELNQTQDALDTALNKLEAIKPKPDTQVKAYQPDARIVSVDLANGIVYLDIGHNDHAYMGLTFSVYDKNAPLPEDGKGKAEIEIFQLRDNSSAARIVRQNPTNPIVREDLVANLIWDSEESNKFVVLGAFDFDDDGDIESNGDEKIMQLINRWGGDVMDNVNINTDFLVLGYKPKALPKPTRTQIENDPMIEQRYEESLQKAQEYEQTLARASKLSIPVFNQDRFMYLIGYNSIAKKSKPIF